MWVRRGGQGGGVRIGGAGTRPHKGGSHLIRKKGKFPKNGRLSFTLLQPFMTASGEAVGQ